MIDIHCHILPGVDDGPATMDEALVMCRAAAADGIHSIVATPHYSPGSTVLTCSGLLVGISALQSRLQHESIDIRILPGAELPVFPELPTMIRSGFLTINGGGYFLLEFRPYAAPVNVETFMDSLLDTGFTPVIAHPERCDWIIRQPDFLTGLIQRGALVQVTAGSLLGEFGPDAQKAAVRLLKSGQAHLIASDGHDRSDRPVRLSPAVHYAATIIGTERAEAMVTTIPAAVIANRRPQLPAVAISNNAPPQRGSWLRRLFGRA